MHLGVASDAKPTERRRMPTERIMQSSSALRAEGEEKEPRVEVVDGTRFEGVRGAPEVEVWRRPETDRWVGVAIVGGSSA